MIKFYINNPKYEHELLELIRPFEIRTNESFSIEINYETFDGEIKIAVNSDKFENFLKVFRFPFFADGELEIKRVEKRFIKIALYRTLSFLTNINLPYGCLTGIRPTKLYREIEKNFDDYKKSAVDVFLKDYSLCQSKVDLIKKTYAIQKPLLNINQDECDLFVFIPFCPTKCSYCTFVSLPLEKQKKLVEPYVDCLVEEIENSKKIIKDKKLKVRSIYVGGGTPTCIPSKQLDRVLSHLDLDVKEFTVEAGRPDTITRGIVKVLIKNGVNRISINPQTFNDKTLQKIGRKHKSTDIDKAFKLTKGKFDINMDLIAMLPDESFEDFKFTVDKAISFKPENITVHTLYMKKGSELEKQGKYNQDIELANQMVDYARYTLAENGYNPYYMYRQKYTSGDLENVGYSKIGKECIYNIDIMEENTSIFANGANAVSKKWIEKDNFIERNGNYKLPLEYIKNFDNVLKKQNEFWKDF